MSLITKTHPVDTSPHKQNTYTLQFLSRIALLFDKQGLLNTPGRFDTARNTSQLVNFF